MRSLTDCLPPPGRDGVVVMMGVIDVHEPRCVSVTEAEINVENTFLRSDNNQRIVMPIRGNTTEWLMRMNSDLYRPYISMV